MSMRAVFHKNQLKQMFNLAVSRDRFGSQMAACSRGQNPRFLRGRTSVMSVIKHDKAAVAGGREGEDDPTRLIKWETRRANLQGSGDPT
jgi:hypothetical protein